MHIILQKTITGFSPADTASAEFHAKLKPGQIIHGDYKKQRNPKFHRLFFAMLNFAFEYWQPGEISSEHGTPEKNFDRFRKDLLILAGFYHTTIRLNGSTRIEAKSISFGKMDEIEFRKVYISVLTVIVDRIMSNYSMDEVNQMIEQFAGESM